MEYKIKGRAINYHGMECGIYKSPNIALRMEYAVLDPGALVHAINTMSSEQALNSLTDLREKASQQANWQHTPQNQGFPVLRQIPSEPAFTIDEVRENIRNTVELCDTILNALKS